MLPKNYKTLEINLEESEKADAFELEVPYNDRKFEPIISNMGKNYRNLVLKRHEKKEKQEQK